MTALLFFFAIIYFLYPLRLYFIKKMKTEAALVVVFSCMPTIYYYVFAEKGTELGLLLIAEFVVTFIAMASIAVWHRALFLTAYALNGAIFLYLFYAPMVKAYHEMMHTFKPA